MSGESERQFEKGNLVVLMFDEKGSRSICVRELSTVEIRGFNVDLDRGTWTYKYSDPPGTERENSLNIGNSRGDMSYHFISNRAGVVGVYDRTDIDHLYNMVRATHEVTQNPPHGHLASDD